MPQTQIDIYTETDAEFEQRIRDAFPQKAYELYVAMLYS